MDEFGGALESTPVGPVGDYALSCVQREEAFAEARRRVAEALLAFNAGFLGPYDPQPVTLALSPNTAFVRLDQTQQFTATVGGTNNTAVTWTINGIIGGDIVAVEPTAEQVLAKLNRKERRIIKAESRTSAKRSVLVQFCGLTTTHGNVLDAEAERIDDARLTSNRAKAKAARKARIASPWLNP